MPGYDYSYDWNNIPGPLLLMILRKLCANDVIACSEVSVYWHLICEDKLLWKHLFLQEYGWRQVVTKHIGPAVKGDVASKSNSKRWKKDYIWHKRYYSITFELYLNQMKRLRRCRNKYQIQT